MADDDRTVPRIGVEPAEYEVKVARSIISSRAIQRTTMMTGIDGINAQEVALEEHLGTSDRPSA